MGIWGGTGVESIPVVVAGVTGRTGEAVGKAIHQASGLTLVGAISQNHGGDHLGERWHDDRLDLAVVREITGVDAPAYAVLVDFTEAESAFERLQWAIVHHWDIVVGTTGFSSAQQDRLASLVQEHQVGAVIISNFSIGAWFLERVAMDASRFFDAAEIIEEHHEAKRDRPSGTARRMQSLLAQAWHRSPEHIPVHSVRLPGLIAHQSVIFGVEGQVLRFRHDVHDRSAYALGVIRAIEKVHTRRGEVVSDLGVILEAD